MGDVQMALCQEQSPGKPQIPMSCLEAVADQRRSLLLSCSVGESSIVIRCRMSSLKGPLSQVMAVNGAESPSLFPMLRSPGTPSAPAADKAVPQAASFIPSSHNQPWSLRVPLSFNSKDLDKYGHEKKPSEGSVLLG